MVHRATDAVGRQRPFESRKEIHKKRRSREREASQQDKARNSVPMWNNEEKCKLQRSATPQSSLGAADRSIALTFPRVPAALCISYPIFCPPPPLLCFGTNRSLFFFFPPFSPSRNSTPRLPYCQSNVSRRTIEASRRSCLRVRFTLSRARLFASFANCRNHHFPESHRNARLSSLINRA